MLLFLDLLCLSQCLFFNPMHFARIFFFSFTSTHAHNLPYFSFSSISLASLGRRWFFLSRLNVSPRSTCKWMSLNLIPLPLLLRPLLLSVRRTIMSHWWPPSSTHHQAFYTIVFTTCAFQVNNVFDESCKYCIQLTLLYYSRWITLCVHRYFLQLQATHKHTAPKGQVIHLSYPWWHDARWKENAHTHIHTQLNRKWPGYNYTREKDDFLLSHFFTCTSVDVARRKKKFSFSLSLNALAHSMHSWVTHWESTSKQDATDTSSTLPLTLSSSMNDWVDFSQTHSHALTNVH